MVGLKGYLNSCSPNYFTDEESSPEGFQIVEMPGREPESPDSTFPLTFIYKIKAHYRKTGTGQKSPVIQSSYYTHYQHFVPSVTCL